MHSEIGGVLPLLHPRAVEGARAVSDGRAAAAGALVCLLLRSCREEQQLDAPVRRRFERLFPAAGGTAVSPGLFLPPLQLLRLVAEPSLLEPRLCDREQVCRARILLALRPADDGLRSLAREHRLEVALCLLWADDDDT